MIVYLYTMKQRTIDTFFNDSRKRSLEESNTTDQYNIGRVHAIIYKWEFTPPFAHVLANCCYFGQTRQELDARTRQHKYDSLSDPKELGLHALWRQFPYESYWKIYLLEEEYFENVVSAGEWMNQREITLIQENGGILKNMDAKLKQTLNLTSGGQGNPQKVYECILAKSRKKLNKKWPAFKKFYARENNIQIPRDHKENVNGEEIKLGLIVNGIRTKGYFLQHLDFKKWLDAHNFVYDERRAHLELEVWPAFKKFYARETHFQIPQNHREIVNGEEIELGHIASHIRSQGCFLQYKDFAMWLWCGCFKMHALNGDKNTVKWNGIFKH